MFKALVDSRATKNHMSPAVIKRMGLPYRQKENPYPLVIISGDLILYENGIIYFETGPVEIEIKGQKALAEVQ